MTAALWIENWLEECKQKTTRNRIWLGGRLHIAADTPKAYPLRAAPRWWYGMASRGYPISNCKISEKDQGSLKLGTRNHILGKILGNALKKTSPSCVRSAGGRQEKRQEPLGAVDRTRQREAMSSAGARGGQSPPEIPTLASQPAGRTGTLPLDEVGFH